MNKRLFLRDVNGKWQQTSVDDNANVGIGLEGKVYTSNDGKHCIKIFHKSSVAETRKKSKKLYAMLDTKYDRIRSLDENRGGCVAWPTHTVHRSKNKKSFIGYSMHLFENTMGLDLLHRETSTISKNTTHKDRIQISLQLIAAFGFLAQMGVIVGDVRPENIRIKRVGDKWAVYIIDPDSFQLMIGDSPSTTDVGTDDYSSPRLLRQVVANPRNGYKSIVRLHQDDQYALIVILFQNIMNGHHPLRSTGTTRSIATNAMDGVFPYAGGKHRPKKSAPIDRYLALPSNLKELFKRAFCEEKYGDMSDWTKALATLPSYEPAPSGVNSPESSISSASKGGVDTSAFSRKVKATLFILAIAMMLIISANV